MIPKNSVVPRITRGVLIVLTGLCLLSWNAVPGLAQAVGTGQIEGFWVMTFTLPPNGFLPTEIHLLTNFTRDGNVIVSMDLPTLPVDPGFPIPYPKLRAGLGHGAWTRTGFPPGLVERGKIIVDLWRFTTCAQPAGCTIPVPVLVTGNEGDVMAWARGKAEITVNPRTQTMEGIVQVQLYTKDRQTPLLPPLPGTLVGERIQPEPINP